MHRVPFHLLASFCTSYLKSLSAVLDAHVIMKVYEATKSIRQLATFFFWSSCASWVRRLPQGTAGDLELQIGVQPSTVTAPRLIGILVGSISLNQNARIVVVTWYDIGISISQVWLFCNYLFRVSHDNTYETLTLRNASKMRNMCTNDLHGWR